jgi:hypothetical protein
VNSPNRFCEGVLCGFCELALRSTAKQKGSKLCIDEKLEIDSGIGTGLQCIFQLYYAVAQLQRMQRGSMPRIRGKQQTKAAADGHNIRRSHGKLWKLNGSVLQITYFE